jgi:hypothetical protein
MNKQRVVLCLMKRIRDAIIYLIFNEEKITFKQL